MDAHTDWARRSERERARTLSRTRSRVRRHEGEGMLVSECKEGGGVRSGPGVARTILLFHIISARPSKQPLRVRTFLKVYMELGS